MDKLKQIITQPAFIILLIIFLGTQLKAQTEYFNTVYTEINLNYENYVVNIRPMFYTFKTDAVSDNWRADFMFGKKLGSQATLLAIWKSDTKGLHRAGFNATLREGYFNSKLSISLQMRYFWGLFKSTTDQFYFMPAINYKLGRVKTGIWTMFRKTGNSWRYYIGPSVTISCTKNISLFSAYNKDMIGDRFWYIGGIYYKIEMAKKTNETADIFETMVPELDF